MDQFEAEIVVTASKNTINQEPIQPPCWSKDQVMTKLNNHQERVGKMTESEFCNLIITVFGILNYTHPLKTIICEVLATSNPAIIARFATVLSCKRKQEAKHEMEINLCKLLGEEVKEVIDSWATIFGSATPKYKVYSPVLDIIEQIAVVMPEQACVKSITSSKYKMMKENITGVKIRFNNPILVELLMIKMKTESILSISDNDLRHLYTAILRDVNINVELNELVRMCRNKEFMLYNLTNGRRSSPNTELFDQYDVYGFVQECFIGPDGIIRLYMSVINTIDRGFMLPKRDVPVEV